MDITTAEAVEQARFLRLVEKGRRRAAERNRRERAARARGRHTDAEWRALVAAFRGACCKCGDVPEPSYTCRHISLHKGHIVPISREDLSPSDSIENLQPLCWRCNLSAGPRDTTDYRPRWWRGLYAAALLRAQLAKGA